MNILKNLYWNYQNKYYIAEKAIYNLNRKRCENSSIVLLSYNINIMDTNCSTTIEDNTKSNKSNNVTIPNTASSTTPTTSGYSGPSRSNIVSRLRPSRGQSNRSVPRRYKESTSFSMANRQNPQVTMNFSPNLILNPHNFNHFQNFHSFCHSQGLVQLISPLLTEQHVNFSTQKFRDECLFSEQDSISSGSQSSESSNAHNKNWRELRDKEIIQNLRKWIKINESVDSSPGIEFLLMSYNILAQNLLVEHEYIYRKHHPRALLWETRWKTLYKEITDHNPDILCLQEVQESHLENYYSKFLKKGYAFIFKKKTGMRSDGCAIYYKKSMFKLIENITVELNQGHFALDRDNVAIVAKFASVQNPKSEVVVVTTHLLFNPRREDVRLAQTQVLLAEVERIAYVGKNKYLPIIITGDFNTPPYKPVYNLLTKGSFRYENVTKRTLQPANSTKDVTGKILIPSSLRITDSCQHFDLIELRKNGKKLTRAKELEIINLRHSKRKIYKELKPVNNSEIFSTGILSHNLTLQSAFSYSIGNNSEATTYQDEWINVDYIFYSGKFNKKLAKICDSKLKIISRFSVPTSTEMKKIQYIPNFALGSDHLSLIVKFKLED